MPMFYYRALDARGDTLKGQMEAANDLDVAKRLQEQGLLPIETQQSDAIIHASSPLVAAFRKAPFDSASLVQLTQQLATLMGAGQPLDRALSILADQPDETKSRIVTSIRNTVRNGTPLSTALEQQHGLFSRLYISLVRAGEAGGNLHQTLQRLADYLERSNALKSKVINALIYPVILLVVVGLAVGFLLGYVVPQFGAMYESLNVDLPWFSRCVLLLGQFVKDWWLGLICLVAVALILVERKRQDVEFRKALDFFLLKQRVTGMLIGRIETARLARTLGTLLRNGVPLINGLDISSKVISNSALAQDVREAMDDVKNGHGLSHALGRNKRFPRLALQMIQVGEESGALDQMLLKAADTFEQEVALAIDRLLAALVPVITLAMASIVGGVIMAVLVPLYDLTNAIG